MATKPTSLKTSLTALLASPSLGWADTQTSITSFETEIMPCRCLLAPGLTWHCKWMYPSTDLADENTCRIAGGEAINWCSRMVVCTAFSGGRDALDPRAITTQAKRGRGYQYKFLRKHNLKTHTHSARDPRLHDSSSIDFHLFLSSIFYQERTFRVLTRLRIVSAVLLHGKHGWTFKLFKWNINTLYPDCSKQMVSCRQATAT